MKKDKTRRASEPAKQESNAHTQGGRTKASDDGA